MSSPSYDWWFNGKFDKSNERRPSLSIYGDGKRTPSTKERQNIFSRGGVVVNLDTNWAPKSAANPYRRTGPMVVIPNRATQTQRSAAEQYAQRMADLYNRQFGTTYSPRVLTRGENGRGRPATIHTEPYALTDRRAVDYFGSDEGQRKYAEIVRTTLGSIPGAQFSLPHNPSRGDYGAYGSGTNEVQRARGVLSRLGGPVSQPQSSSSGLPGLHLSEGSTAPKSPLPPVPQRVTQVDGQRIFVPRPQAAQRPTPRPAQKPAPRPTGAAWVNGNEGMQPLFASDATPQQLREHFPRGGGSPSFANFFKGLLK